MKRKISLLLILCLIFGCIGILSSCDPEESDDGPEIEGLDVAWAKDLDFDGVTLTVSQSVNVWDPSSSIDNAAKFTMAKKANNADTVLNACYERNEAVKKTLNLNVNYVETDLFYDGLADYIMSIITQQQAVDLIINDVYGVIPAALNGYLFNLKTEKLAGNAIDNYFNFEHASWYDDYMKGLTIDQSKMYGLAGHYFMDIVRTAHCLYVNTDIFEDKCGNIYPEMDTFYKDVEEGLFTYDVFNELIYLAWEDAGKRGETDLEDKLGLLNNVYSGMMCYIYGAQISAFDYSGKEVVLKPNISDEINTVATIIDSIMYQDGTYVANLTDQEVTEAFISGGTMFVNNKWLGHLEHSAFQAMDNKAAIVYPKINEDYEYSTYVHNSAEIGYIPVTCQNFVPVTAYVQLLNEQSTTIITSYFENQLKYKYNTAETSAAIDMLDLINETIGSPAYEYWEYEISKLGNATQTPSCIAIAVRDHNPTNAATQYQANLSAYEAGLRAMKEKFSQLP